MFNLLLLFTITLSEHLYINEIMVKMNNASDFIINSILEKRSFEVLKFFSEFSYRIKCSLWKVDIDSTREGKIIKK